MDKKKVGKKRSYIKVLFNLVSGLVKVCYDHSCARVVKITNSFDAKKVSNSTLS